MPEPSSLRQGIPPEPSSLWRGAREQPSTSCYNQLLTSARLFSLTLPHEAFALTEHDPLGRLLASAGPFGRLLPHEAFALTEHDLLCRLLTSAGLFSRMLPNEAFALHLAAPISVISRHRWSTLSAPRRIDLFKMMPARGRPARSVCLSPCRPDLRDQSS